MYLEYVAYYERFRVVIHNSGYRPITVLDITLELLDKEGHPMEGVPLNAIFDDEEDEKQLPNTIKDGEHLTLNLSEHFRQFSPGSDEQLCITVYDADGNKYSPKKIRVYDGKWGGYSFIEK